MLFSVYVRDSNKGGFACKIATFRGTVAKPVVKEQSDAKAALPPKKSLTLRHEKRLFCLPDKRAFFSYIRLRRVILLRSYICPTDKLYCACAQLRGEYNITLRLAAKYNYAVRHNITAASGGNITYTSGTRPIFLLSCLFVSFVINLNHHQK